jgi:hypothetical protein
VNKLRGLPAALILGCAGAILFGSVHRATAAAGQRQSGVTVSPAFQQVSVKPGDAQQPVNFTITNDKPVAQTFDISADDFNTLGESGGLFFVGTNPTELQKKYGLAKWVSLSQKQITLQPKQSISLQAKILNLPDLAPGGHYGALMIAATNSNHPAQTSNNVALHPIASSLLFVTKVGGDTHKLSLSTVAAKHSLFAVPESVTLRFHNDGNTHVVPRGNVMLSSSGGKLISKGVINQDSTIVLPEASRQYSVVLAPINGGGRPGKYVLRVDFRFDGISQFRSYQQSFRLLPAKYILGIALLILVGIIIQVRRKSLIKKRWRKRKYRIQA